MRRRDFILGLGGAAIACPLAARAQQTIPTIGFLDSGARTNMDANLAAFHQGLGESGFTEGRNVAVEYSFANGQYDRLPALDGVIGRRSC